MCCENAHRSSGGGVANVNTAQRKDAQEEEEEEGNFLFPLYHPPPCRLCIYLAYLYVHLLLPLRVLGQGWMTHCRIS